MSGPNPTGAPVVVTTTGEMAEYRGRARGDSGIVGFVPTMGSLHEGHATLLREARVRCDSVVLSIFVNPTQFDSGTDLETYPRDREADLQVAAECGVDVVYLPDVDQVYPPGFATSVVVDGLTDVLCGAPSSRGSGHFRGVTTVVAKLLNLVDPDLAFFGRKDAQQAAVVSRMARDLDMRTEIVVVPTVREPDGLAMSSRNARLSPEARTRARALSRALVEAEATGISDGAEAAVAAALTALREQGLEPEYVEARTIDGLRPAIGQPGEPWMVALAVEVDGVRLIDNVVVGEQLVIEAGVPAAEEVAG